LPSFNLVDEGWIPCVLPDGSLKLMGLKHALVNSHMIKEISDSSPLVSVALLRLMLAILHRTFGPNDMDKWVALWQAGKWDGARLSDYFEKWRHRFDLFDQERPFYQSQELRGAEKHPLLHLAMEISSGNNATLFDHSSDETPSAVTAAGAARYLIATQAYAIGFGKSSPFYFSDSPLIRGLTVLALGDNFFQTLALNLIEYSDHLPFERSGEDVPIWEQDNPAHPDHAGTPIRGYLDYLTWQSRNIHLFPEGNPPVVRWCQIQQRLKLPKQQYLDPFKCYDREEERGFVPKPIKPDKAAWRDSHALFQKAGGGFKRPEVFNWLARIDNRRRDGEIQAKPAYSLIVTGLATDPGKAGSVLLWLHERLPLPLKYLEDRELIARLKDALDLAEKVGGEKASSLLNNSAWNLARLVFAPEKKLNERLSDAQRKDIGSFVNSLSPTRPYWASLGISFNRLVTDLANDKSGDDQYGAKVLPWWAGEVGKSARRAFRETTDSLDHSSRWLKAVTVAENNFNAGLNMVIKEFLEPYKES
jgi:CRISPR system Cascade subunit CasA